MEGLYDTKDCCLFWVTSTNLQNWAIAVPFLYYWQENVKQSWTYKPRYIFRECEPNCDMKNKCRSKEGFLKYLKLKKFSQSYWHSDNLKKTMIYGICKYMFAFLLFVFCGVTKNLRTLSHDKGVGSHIRPSKGVTQLHNKSKLDNFYHVCNLSSGIWAGIVSYFILILFQRIPP